MSLLEREREKKNKFGNTEHVRTYFNINSTCVCGNIGITGLPTTSVCTVGCGLDARVLSTLLLRDVPFIRQGVRAAFCVKKQSERS